MISLLEYELKYDSSKFMDYSGMIVSNHSMNPVKSWKYHQGDDVDDFIRQTITSYGFAFIPSYQSNHWNKQGRKDLIEVHVNDEKIIDMHIYTEYASIDNGMSCKTAHNHAFRILDEQLALYERNEPYLSVIDIVPPGMFTHFAYIARGNWYKILTGYNYNYDE